MATGERRTLYHPLSGPLGVGRRGTGHYRDPGYRQEIVWVRPEILPETIFAIGLVCVCIFLFSSLIHFFSILLLCGRSKIIENQSFSRLSNLKSFLFITEWGKILDKKIVVIEMFHGQLKKTLKCFISKILTSWWFMLYSDQEGGAISVPATCNVFRRELLVACANLRGTP